jgi:hypothetical protein
METSPFTEGQGLYSRCRGRTLSFMWFLVKIRLVVWSQGGDAAPWRHSSLSLGAMIQDGGHNGDIQWRSMQSCDPATCVHMWKTTCDVVYFPGKKSCECSLRKKNAYVVQIKHGEHGGESHALSWVFQAGKSMEICKGTHLPRCFLLDSRQVTISLWATHPFKLWAIPLILQSHQLVRACIGFEGWKEAPIFTD